MQLTLAFHPITTIGFGAQTCLAGTTLLVNQDELRRLVLEDAAIEAVDFAVAQPGESLRAGPLFDIVEPRAKAPGGSPDWPGILGAPLSAGDGVTHVLAGAAVTMLREDSSGDSHGATGYVLEMSGEAAAGSRYAALTHLLVVPHTKAKLPAAVRQKSYRLAQLKVAVRLARAAFDSAPARSEVLDISGGEERSGLARVTYVGQIFRGSESRKLKNIFFTARTPTACCRRCFIPTNGSTARWCRPITRRWAALKLIFTRIIR